MKIISVVPFIYEAKVTALKYLLYIDTIDHLAAFTELEQFETKMHESKMDTIIAPVEKMKF